MLYLSCIALGDYLLVYLPCDSFFFNNTATTDNYNTLFDTPFPDAPLPV